MCCAKAPSVDVSKVAKVQRVNRDEVVFSGSETASGWKELPSSQLNHPGLVSRCCALARDHVEYAITPRVALLCPWPNNGASLNMVVVRESPRARISPDKNCTTWPPRSPFEALMATPTGKKRWEDDRRRDQERSPSPSPLRRPMSSSKALQDVAMADDDDDDDEDGVEEEDEETLQIGRAHV